MENKELIQKLIKDLYKYAFGRLNSKEQAEDVTSETITRLVSKMQNESLTPEQIRMVSFGIAKNVLFEKYREETKINHDEINEELEMTDQESLEEVVMKDEMIELIKSELNTLDKTTKDILILKIWEDLKFKEIAELNNTNENTIKTIYYKGLNALKKQLEVKHGTKAYSFTIPSIILGLSLYSDSVAAQIPATFLAGTLASVPASLFIMFSNMANPVIAAGSTAVGASQKDLVSKFISTTIGKLVIGGVATTVAVGTGVGGAVLVKNNIDNTNTLEPISYLQSDYNLDQKDNNDEVIVQTPVETKEVKFCIDNYTEPSPNCLTEITAMVPKDAVITTPVTEGAGPAPKTGVAKITGNGFNFLIVAPFEAFSQQFVEATEIKEGIFRVKAPSNINNGYLYSSNTELKTKSSCQFFEEKLNYPCGLTVVRYTDNIGLSMSCDASSDVKICDAIVKSLKVTEKRSQVPEGWVTATHQCGIKYSIPPKSAPYTWVNNEQQTMFYGKTWFWSAGEVILEKNVPYNNFFSLGYDCNMYLQFVPGDRKDFACGTGCVKEIMIEIKSGESQGKTLDQLMNQVEENISILNTDLVEEYGENTYAIKSKEKIQKWGKEVYKFNLDSKAADSGGEKKYYLVVNNDTFYVINSFSANPDSTNNQVIQSVIDLLAFTK